VSARRHLAAAAVVRLMGMVIALVCSVFASAKMLSGCTSNVLIILNLFSLIVAACDTTPAFLCMTKERPHASFQSSVNKPVNSANKTKLRHKMALIKNFFTLPFRQSQNFIELVIIFTADFSNFLILLMVLKNRKKL
jgi:hypothetical protein